MFTILRIDERIEPQNKFRQIINQIRVYKDPMECEKDLCEESSEMEKYVLIISGSAKTRQLIICSYDLHQLTRYYVFCRTNPLKINQQWAEIFFKVKRVFHKIDNLFDILSNEQKLRAKIDDSSLPIHIYNRNSSENQTLQSRNALFLYFQLFINVLFEMTDTDNDPIELKQDFNVKRSLEIMCECR